jgi:hypothetical protein
MLKIHIPFGVGRFVGRFVARFGPRVATLMPKLHLTVRPGRNFVCWVVPSGC